MNQYVIEDMVVITVILNKQKQYLSNYMASSYVNFPFMQGNNVTMRMHKHHNFMSDLTEFKGAENAGKAADIKILCC